MTNNLSLVVKKYFSSLYKDYRILKVSFTVLTVYLLLYELDNYFVTRPTFQSVTQTEVGPGYFPDILLCPRQSFSLEQLQQLGREYKTSQFDQWKCQNNNLLEGTSLPSLNQ